MTKTELQGMTEDQLHTEIARTDNAMCVFASARDQYAVEMMATRIGQLRRELRRRESIA